MPNTNRHHDAATVTVSDNHHHSPPPKTNPKFLSFVLKVIVMCLVLSLFLIFIGLAAIFLLHLLLIGNFLHRRRQHATLPPDNYSLLDLQTHIPSFEYSAGAAASSSSSSAADCSICLEGFKGGEFCRALPVCDHFFHAKCVDSWLTKVPNCPVCRTPVRLEVDRPADSIVSDDDCRLFWAIGVGRHVVVDY